VLLGVASILLHRRVNLVDALCTLRPRKGLGGREVCRVDVFGNAVDDLRIPRWAGVTGFHLFSETPIDLASTVGNGHRLAVDHDEQVATARRERLDGVAIRSRVSNHGVNLLNPLANQLAGHSLASEHEIVDRLGFLIDRFHFVSLVCASALRSRAPASPP
jgi:hypothetical protein